MELGLCKRRKMQSNKDNGSDLFDMLPEQVICSITSSLPFRQAVSLSAVSKNWVSRWKSCWNIDLDLDFVCPEKDRKHKNRLELKKELSFLLCAKQVVKSHQAETIESFRISCVLVKDYALPINDWVLFAFRKRARTIVIDLCKYDFVILRTEEMYELPRALSPSVFASQPSLTALTLKSFLLGPLYFGCFPSLQSLWLESSNVSQQHVDDILSNCLQLQTLVLLKCRGPEILKFHVPPHHQLKHLSVCGKFKLSNEENYYIYKQPEKLQIEGADKLEYLECVADTIPCSILRKFWKLRVLKLVMMSLLSGGITPIRYALGDLAKDAPNLESLHLTFNSVSVVLELQNFASRSNMPLPNFTKLRHLLLCDTHVHRHDFITLVMVFLKMAHNLESLELHLAGNPYGYSDHDFTKWIPAEDDDFDFNFKHDNLGMVKIYGFQYCQKKLGIVVCLLQSALNLTTMQFFGDNDLNLTTRLGSGMSPIIHDWHCVSQNTKKWLMENVSFKAELEFM